MSREDLGSRTRAGDACIAPATLSGHVSAEPHAQFIGGGTGAPAHGLALGTPGAGRRTVIKAAHRYEVVDIMSRLNIAGARYHFIGAGGVGMSGLARLLIGKKAIVTGSDQTNGLATSRLNGLGAHIHLGHNAANLDPATDVVVVSAAIDENNPELQTARQRGCRVVKYAQLLGELMNHFEGIAVSGTHGKSTTSGWLVYCLKRAGCDPNFVVGAEILQLGSSSGCGDSDVFVVEACEYDRSFHNFKPSVACILNIERDHLDCYKDEDDIIESFCQFARGTRPDGLIVANGDDANVARMLSRLGGSEAGPKVVTFGLDLCTSGSETRPYRTECNFSARNLVEVDGFYQFDVFQDGRRLGPARISLPGLHNVRNAMAVIAVAVSIGVEPERILGTGANGDSPLQGFQGMDRRLMLKGRFNEIAVLDDYAHHPTEIQASLAAIRQRYHPRRLWCVFQAHQYSRTHALLEDFARSFAQADKVILPEIYFARDSEASRNAVNAPVLAERIRDCGTDVEHIATFAAACDYLEKHVTAGDVVVTMGAGDVWKVADEYIQRLRRNR